MKAYEALPTSVCLFQMLIRLLQLKHMGDGDRIFAAVSPLFIETLKNSEVCREDCFHLGLLPPGICGLASKRAAVVSV